jgi:hypothetical protein
MELDRLDAKSWDIVGIHLDVGFTDPVDVEIELDAINIALRGLCV